MTHTKNYQMAKWEARMIFLNRNRKSALYEWYKPRKVFRGKTNDAEE